MQKQVATHERADARFAVSPLCLCSLRHPNIRRARIPRVRAGCCDTLTGMEEAAFEMPLSVPSGLRLELSRARLLPGREQVADEWMEMLHRHHGEIVTNLDGERMAIEATFRHSDSDGTQWIYHFSLFGETGSGLDTSNPISAEHDAYARRCKEPGWEELRPVLLLAPPPVMRVIEQWGKDGTVEE